MCSWKLKGFFNYLRHNSNEENGVFVHLSICTEQVALELARDPAFLTLTDRLFHIVVLLYCNVLC